MRSGYLGVMVMVVVSLSTAAVAHDLGHLLMSVPGATGTFSGDQYSNWIVGVNVIHNIPDLPQPLALLSGAVPERNEGSFAYPEGKAIVFTKEIDKSSAVLMDYCRQGRVIPSMKLALCRNVEGRLKLLVSLNFEEVKCTCYQVFAPGFGDRNTLFPVEDAKPIELLLLMPKHVRWKLALM